MESLDARSVSFRHQIIHIIVCIITKLDMTIFRSRISTHETILEFFRFLLDVHIALTFFGLRVRKCRKECFELYFLYVFMFHKTHRQICQHVERNIAVAQQRFWHQFCFGNYSHPTPTSKNLIMHQWREYDVLWKVNGILQVENQVHSENFMYNILQTVSEPPSYTS